MINGEGKLITDKDEKGHFLPFMSTDEILKQLAKFGFYIQYDVKNNLPTDTFVFLQHVSLLGYDKITKVLLQTQNKQGDTIWQPSIIVFKSVSDNVDLLSYGQKLYQNKYIKKVNNNTVLNVTEQEGVCWDWVTSYFNILDILNENVDTGTSHFVETSVPESSCPAGFTPYIDPHDLTEGDYNGN